MELTLARRVAGQQPIVNDDALLDELIDFLKGEQDRQAATDAVFAESLDVSRTYWVNVKHRAQGLRPGPSFLLGVINSYPEWKDRIRAMVKPELSGLL